MEKETILQTLQNYNPYNEQEMEYKNQMIEFVHDNDVLFSRENINGHIVVASWIVSRDKKSTLLTHHNKLDIWLQPGGHIEDNEELTAAALREAREETGLTSIKLLSKEIFDIDVHEISGNTKEKAHMHYCIRFLFEADITEKIEVSSESKDVKWVELDRIREYSEYSGMIRMADKTKFSATMVR